MSVEFMVGVDEPPIKRHSIYTDLASLPDPVELGLTARIFNYDSVTLYMKMDGSGPGWTFTENNLGSLASGANMYENIDDLGSKAKPASETVESITVRLRAYTDAGYANLKWTYERSIVMVFLKTDDGSWTTSISNNFDDGTVQGWLATEVCEVASDYVLSVPYSCRGDYSATKPSLYIGSAKLHALEIQKDTEVILKFGKEYRAKDSTIYVPMNKWMRFVVPLSPSETFELELFSDWSVNAGTFWSFRKTGRLYKSITTPSAAEVYAIINARFRYYNTGTGGNITYHAVAQIDDFLVLYR